MLQGQVSGTALRVAAQRAAHQTLEGGRVFRDPLASALLGADAHALIEKASADPSQRQMRLLFAARSRFAEDCLGVAVTRGVRQTVILGAGLDTFSLRNPYGSVGLRVFEVDHPSTQIWKRQRMEEAGIEVPGLLSFVPVDFEHQNLADELLSAGFHPNLPAFFCWLGVVPYLRKESIFEVLRFIATVPEAEVVFDYSEPLGNYSPERRASVAAVAARTAAIGEPWLSYFDPNELSDDLHNLGFQGQEDIGFAEIAVRYLGIPQGGTKSGAGPHIILARCFAG